MSEIRHWPQCGRCSDQKRGWWPVEEYEVAWERSHGPFDRARAVVIGRCSHGKGFKQGTVREQVATIDVPHWWGEAHVKDAIRRLVFFKCGQGAPEHGLVTRIG